MKYLLLFLLALPYCVRSDNIMMLVRDDVYKNYLEFLDGRDVQSITSFTGKLIRRDVVDMIIVQQALKLGGFLHEFEYGYGKVNFRNTQMLVKGQLLLSFDSYWSTDAKEISEHVYISEPVIRYGEYHAGIFASPNHPSIFSLTSLEGLSKYTAVSTPKWITDWNTLSELPLKELVREDEWVSQARMVEKQWVDFFLMPFHRLEGEVYEFDNVRLKHVAKVAILLKDSRHYVISKRHPLGKEAFNAINKGLEILRKEKRIYKAYKEAGFIIDTENYKVLNR